jgi:hypothetical protein
MFKCFISDNETGKGYLFDNVNATTTVGQLKQRFAQIKGVQPEKLCAWVGSPLVDDNMTLGDYNVAYDDIIIIMATEWDEEMLRLLKYYK